MLEHAELCHSGLGRLGRRLRGGLIESHADPIFSAPSTGRRLNSSSGGAALFGTPSLWSSRSVDSERWSGAMPELTRRRSTDAREECWHTYYGDVHAGTIAIRSGNPHDEDPWEWHCGFYPGSHPGEHQSGTAATFDQARSDFEAAWEVFLANRTQADFRAWRDQRDWTARKYEMWTTGEKLPSQKPSSMMRCPCGEMFDSHRLENTLIHVPHIPSRAQIP